MANRYHSQLVLPNSLGIQRKKRKKTLSRYKNNARAVARTAQGCHDRDGNINSRSQIVKFADLSRFCRGQTFSPHHQLLIVPLYTARISPNSRQKALSDWSRTGLITHTTRNCLTGFYVACAPVAACSYKSVLRSYLRSFRSLLSFRGCSSYGS